MNWRPNLAQNLAIDLILYIWFILLLIFLFDNFGLTFSVIKFQYQFWLWIYMPFELKFVDKTVSPIVLVIVFSFA